MPKLSGYAKTFKDGDGDKDGVKDKSDKLMSFPTAEKK